MPRAFKLQVSNKNLKIECQVMKINNYQMQVKSKENANLNYKLVIYQLIDILTSGKVKENRIHYS